MVIKRLKVVINEELLAEQPTLNAKTLIKVLELDPRPHYHDDENKIYGFMFQGHEIKFNVKKDTLYVTQIVTL